MANFGLVKSFGIDSGELDEFSRQQCFVLGYELAQIDHLLTLNEGIRKPINADNRLRIEAACQEAGRTAQIVWMPGDPSESWMLLKVEPREHKRCA